MFIWTWNRTDNIRIVGPGIAQFRLYIRPKPRNHHWLCHLKPPAAGYPAVERVDQLGDISRSWSDRPDTSCCQEPDEHQGSEGLQPRPGGDHQSRFPRRFQDFLSISAPSWS